MTELAWCEAAAPTPSATHAVLLHAAIGHTADLTATRARLERAVTVGSASPAPAEDLERLLLAFEELASNGYRHGGPPVEVTVTATDSGWLIVVTDRAPGYPPAVAVGRDPAHGGLGLHLVARLAAAVGWATDTHRKHVWARIDRAVTT